MSIKSKDSSEGMFVKSSALKKCGLKAWVADPGFFWSDLDLEPGFLGIIVRSCIEFTRLSVILSNLGKLMHNLESKWTKNHVNPIQ